MSLAFEALEQQLGAATTAAFSNAQAELPLGTVVEGIFTNAYAEAGLGSVGMQAREVIFVADTLAITEAVAKGTRIDITYRGVVTPWRVTLRTDHFESGDTQLDLEEYTP